MCGRDNDTVQRGVALLTEQARWAADRIYYLETEVARLEARLAERERHADALTQHAAEAIRNG